MPLLLLSLSGLSRLARKSSHLSCKISEKESHQHQGHGGWREGGETHFRVEIVSVAFAGKSRLERHRLVNGALAQELAESVHALAIAARAPGEG